MLVKVQDAEFGIPDWTVVPVHAITGVGAIIVLFFCLKIFGVIRASSVELLRNVGHELNRENTKIKRNFARSLCIRHRLEVKLGHFAIAEVRHGFKYVQQIVDGIVMAIFMVNMRYPSWILENM